LTVRDDDGAINSTQQVIVIKSAVTRDVDSDEIDEKAIDLNGNPSDGYETYNDSNGNSNAVKSKDGDGDGKIDHFIDINNDGNPDKYWDPDNGLLTDITIRDVDGDRTKEWLYDSDGDNINDKYYDPDDDKIKNYIGSLPVNHPPNKPTNPSPSDGSTDVPINPTLNVTVTDPDGDTMDVSFYNANGTLIGIDKNVPSGGIASVIWYNLDYNKTYSWYVIVNDDEYSTTSSIWNFTTTTSAPSGKDNYVLWGILILILIILLIILVYIRYRLEIKKLKQKKAYKPKKAKNKN